MLFLAVFSEMWYLRSLLSGLDQEVHTVSGPADGLYRLLMAGISEVHTTHLGPFNTQQIMGKKNFLQECVMLMKYQLNWKSSFSAK